MPILNPRRILTPRGKQAMLASFFAMETDGFLHGKKAVLVRSAEVDALTDEVTSIVLNEFGLETPITMPGFGSEGVSAAGKTYRATAVMQVSAVNPTAPQNVVGVMIGNNEDVGLALAYMDFDDPIVIDESLEHMFFAVEFGFDGQAFYIVPRVLPLGV